MNKQVKATLQDILRECIRPLAEDINKQGQHAFFPRASELIALIMTWGYTQAEATDLMWKISPIFKELRE